MSEAIDLFLDSVCNSKNKQNQEQFKCPLVDKCINTSDLLMIGYQYGTDLTKVVFG